MADQDAIGPVIASGFIPTSTEKPLHKGMSRFVWAAFAHIVAARLSGRWQQTPFFNTDTLQPVCPVQIVDPDTRRDIKARLA